MQDIEPRGRAHISTQAFPENKRLALWREVYGRGIANVDIETIGDGPFHADVTFNLLPNVGIAAGSRSPAHYRVTPELARRGKDIIALSILRSGSASAIQFGKELIDGVGSASVLASTDPSASTLNTDGSFITLALSRPAIAALAPEFAAAFGRPLPSHNTALRLLIRYLDAVQVGSELADADIARSVSGHIIDLVALALGARGDHAEMALRGAKAARLSAIKSDILGMLGRNDLSSDIVAERHGISSRYVRKLFEQDGTSFAAFLLTRRLTRVRSMLLDRRYLHLTIAQLAHGSGFNDISHFNRVFRRHFGTSPSDFRATAKGA